MSKLSDDSSFEESVLSALRKEPTRARADCPDSETLFALAEQRLPEPRATALMEHIAFCSNCRQAYSETLELLQLEKVPAVESKAKPPVVRLVLAGFAGAAVAAGIVFAIFVTPLIHGQNQLAAVISELRGQLSNEAKSNKTLTASMSDAERLKRQNDSLAKDLHQSKELVATLTKSEQALEQIPLPTAHWSIADDNSTLRSLGAPAGTDVQIRLVSPINTAVLTSKPTFTIKSVKGATHYEVSLQEAEGSHDLTPPRQVSLSSWEPRHPLEGGKTYKWAVTAQKGGTVLSSSYARFYVPSSEELGRIDALKKAGNNLPLAAVYASLGLNQLAEAEFRKVLTKDPGSKVAIKWQDELAHRSR